MSWWRVVAEDKYFKDIQHAVFQNTVLPNMAVKIKKLPIG
jgi:hypothetical protein